MKSLITDGKRGLYIGELIRPAIDAYHALVKMEACGVCNGTDLKLIHGDFKNFSTYPAALGHEGVGRVIETGAKVTGLKKGDLVLLPFLNENNNGCVPGWGAFSEYAVVGDYEAMLEDGRGEGTPYFKECYLAQQKLPEGFDPVDAVMIVTFREVLSAARRFGFKANKSIIIFGAGPVGLTFIKFAKLLGMGPVIVFDIVPEKVREALEMGADYAFDSNERPPGAVINEILPECADYVLDAVGSNALINTAMRLIKYNGSICCYGISPKLSTELDWSGAPYNWSVNFVQWPLKKEEAEAHRQVMNWIEAGVLNPRSFISDILPFSKVLDAFDMVENKRASKKIVITF